MQQSTVESRKQIVAGGEGREEACMVLYIGIREDVGKI